MAIHTVPLVASIILVLLILYERVVKPILFSPLAKIPTIHWSASITPLWILNERRKHRDNHAVHDAHKRLGPIVRLAPNEISVNSVDGGIRAIYAGGYEKGNWYTVFDNFDVPPMFAMPHNAPHSKRKRMMSNIYAKSTLQASASLTKASKTLLDDHFIPELRRRSSNDREVELYTAFSAITCDLITAYVFGLGCGSRFIRHKTFGKEFFTEFKRRQLFIFWPQEMPRTYRLLASIGLQDLVRPKWLSKANDFLETWLMDMCDSSEALLEHSEISGVTSDSMDWPTVYAQLRRSIVKDVQSSQTPPNLPDIKTQTQEIVNENRFNIASELLDQVVAGFDTSSITLSFLAWELSRPENTEWQTRLRDEFKQLKDIHDPRGFDALPTLHAILMETLRLHAAIPGNQPRITPAGGVTLGAPGHSVSNIPQGVRVQASAWSLHREPSVFPDPERWDPARWLDATPEHAREMARWFWAFGSGGRMCVGSNLAMNNMKAIIVVLWSSFRTVLVDGEGMVHAGSYLGEPMGKDGKFCVVKLEDL